MQTENFSFLYTSELLYRNKIRDKQFTITTMQLLNVSLIIKKKVLGFLVSDKNISSIVYDLFNNYLLKTIGFKESFLQKAALKLNLEILLKISTSAIYCLSMFKLNAI